VSRNIEIKARYADLKKGRKTAERLGARLAGIDRQTDTYFRVPTGRLKVRESSLKGGELIPYLRPEEGGPKACDYAVIPLENPVKTVELLGAILGVSVVVKKVRAIYLLENVRIHLDDVEGLGRFLEFEAVCASGGEDEERRNRERVSALLWEFGIEDSDLVEGSYHELVKKGVS
jgi:predicted adenylyl cyclase CyaB